MTEFVHASIVGQAGILTLDRPKALNSLSLDMVRAMTWHLRAWREQDAVRLVIVRSSSERAFCAGGDIRFFHQAGSSTPVQGSALIEDFFSEEYALNHLIHGYPKPYLALMDGVVMGGGMGIAQAGENRCRIVTERTKMAMPEVNIGLFPDVGGSFFLSRTPGELGTYLGLSGATIGAPDALVAGLADHYLPSAQLPALLARLQQTTFASGQAVQDAVWQFCRPHVPNLDAASLSIHRAMIDRHFAADQVSTIMASLAGDNTPFAVQTLALMQQRSPLMMCVTLAQLRRGRGMSVADCLRMERTMVRRNFEHGEVLEGVRALVIDKDNAPRWSPAALDQVSDDMVARFFEPAWPEYAHPLRDLA